MKSFRTAFLFGFLLWLIPFLVAFLIYPLREDNRPLFESIMPVVLCVLAVYFAGIYLSTVEADFIRTGAAVGVLWLLVSNVLDLMMFMWGPMKMSFTDYLMDIGITYLIYPAVTIGMGYLLEKRQTVAT